MNLLPRAALATLVLLTAGCGVATPASSPQSEIASAIDQVQEDPTADAVDACSLISDAEVEALIGPNGGASPSTGGGDGGGCTWENSENYYSVTVDIGSSGTAAGGLPPQDPILGPERPLGEGMREFAFGAVEFVAADRLCLVQVATNDTAAEGDEGAAIRLAGAVRDQF